MNTHLALSRGPKQASRDQRSLPCTGLILCVGAALAFNTACGDDGGSVDPVQICQDLSFSPTSWRAVNGTWRNVAVCSEPYRHSSCPEAVLLETTQPLGVTLEFRDDGTWSRTGSHESYLELVAPRHCESMCAVFETIAWDNGFFPTCSENVDGCTCSVTESRTATSAGTWRIDAGLLYMRAVDSDSWGTGREFMVDGAGSLVVKRTTSTGNVVFDVFRP